MTDYILNIFSLFVKVFKKSSISVSGGRDFFGGWSKPDTSREQLWKPKEQYFADLKFIHTIKNIRFTFQSSFFNEVVIDD